MGVIVVGVIEIRFDMFDFFGVFFSFGVEEGDRFDQRVVGVAVGVGGVIVVGEWFDKWIFCVEGVEGVVHGGSGLSQMLQLGECILGIFFDREDGVVQSGDRLEVL